MQEDHSTNSNNVVGGDNNNTDTDINTDTGTNTTNDINSTINIQAGQSVAWHHLLCTWSVTPDLVLGRTGRGQARG